MKQIIFLLLFCLCVLTGCSKKDEQGEIKMKAESYTQISAEEAKSMMDEQEEYTLLDVRSQEEFDEGHIEGALLIPDDEISSRAEQELADKDKVILVYCRSGNRSKLAAEILADLGYTGVYEFGGIIDWPYDIVQ